MGGDTLTHNNFDFRGFDVPELKAVTLAASDSDDMGADALNGDADKTKGKGSGKKSNGKAGGAVARSGKTEKKRQERG